MEISKGLKIIEFIIRKCMYYMLKHDNRIPSGLLADLRDGEKIQGYEKLAQNAFNKVCHDFSVDTDEYFWLRNQIFANWYDWQLRKYINL